VWFDALMNYVTYNELNGKSYWPCDAQIIGKDIMVPAHAIYWPIMLRALDLPIYRQLIVHGWWLIRGGKMSKSLGGTVDPADYAAKYGADALRYFLMREMVIGQDADFSEEKFLARYQSDMANDLGNLVNRALAMINRYRAGVVPAYSDAALTDAEKDLRSNAVLDEFRAAMNGWQAHQGLQAVWKLITRANQYVEETAPWKLAKDEAQKARLDVVLAHLAETVRRISVLIAPVMPTTAEKIQAQLALSSRPNQLEEAIFGSSLTNHKVSTPEPLFPRLEEKK
jgi:methionyl-tRNA synthetase